MAASLGLSGGAQFARMFRQTYGMSPKQWRKRRPDAEKPAPRGIAPGGEPTPP